ncbi:MAG: hypothetical protein U0232_03885 [Thermomicrobiales bacterium]
MYQCIKLYRIWAGQMVLPDHAPHSAVDTLGHRQRSFCLGYTKALIQAATA